MNYGLILISPVVLVRLLSVETFGQYREFLLYTSVLTALAAFGVNSSLLHFVAHRPEQARRFVLQASLMTFATSTLVIGGVAALDFALGGAVVGEYMLPIALYVPLVVNFDFWESLWIAQRRPIAVFGYTTGRLLARLTVVIVAAALSADVDVIIWSLIGLEAVRLSISAVAWLRGRQRGAHEVASTWREQLKFCLPAGTATVLLTLNRSMGSVFVAKLLGPMGLAHYAIGTYVQPVLAVLRNSLSDALLPEMSAQQPSQHGTAAARADPLFLWRRMTVVAAIFLMAAAVVLARFADTLIVTFFTEEYRAAVLVFQIYLFVLVRESMDFSVPLRAINCTAPIMHGTVFSLALNAALLSILLPALGLPGAALAYVISRAVEGIYLGLRTARAYRIAPGELASWGDLAKVVIASLLASITLYGSFWTDFFGLPGVAAGAACFLLTYLALLLLLRVPEAALLLRRVQRLPGVFSTRP